MRLSIFATAAIVLPFVAAQSTTSVEAAVSTVAADATAADADLFAYEQLQLLSSDLDQLNATLAALFAPDNSTDVAATEKRATTCKTVPGDLLWPAPLVWDIFNLLVGGKLIKAVPIAAPCYKGPLYDAARCAVVTAQFTNSDIHELDPTSMMSPVYQGLTCMPTTDPNSGTCTQGGYPTYVVNATNVAQIQLAVNLARSLNIRLVVKNTGHDFSGKSGGAFALSVWTHNFNTIKYLPNYVDTGCGYTGPAFKAGSGVQAKDLYAAAKAQGLTAIGGEGATVGVMGGFIQGGGHSPMGSVYGMAADQVLSMEVVTASGDFVTASSSQNSDLFWALRGGGGGTFGIVTSVTVKAYPRTIVTVTQFSFGVGGNVTEANFWTGVRAYFDYFPSWTDAGMYAYFWVFPNTIFPSTTFIMEPLFSPGLTSAQVTTFLAPWFKTLASLGIVVTPTMQTFDNYYDAWKVGFPQEAVGNPGSIIGSRLWPRNMWKTKATLDAAFASWKSSADAGLILIDFMIAPSLSRGGNPDNSVVPAWRDTLMHAIQAPGWAVGSTDAVVKGWRNTLTAQQNIWKKAGTTGAYLGECDIEDPDFQTSFFGVNYAKLLTIKKKWDPKGVFWVRTGVGSEGFAVKSTDVIKDENGKLCSV